MKTAQNGMVDGPMQDILRQARPIMIATALFSAAVNILMLASPLYMMQVFDRVLSTHSLDTLFWLTLIIAAAFAVLGALDALRSRLLARVGLWAEDRLAPDLMQVSLARTLDGRSDNARPMSDLASIRSLLAGKALFAVFDAPWIPIFLIIIWVLHPLLGAVSLASAVILAGLAVINERRTRKGQQEASAASAAGQNHVATFIRNADAVRAMSILPALAGRWRRVNAKAMEANRLVSDRGSAISGVSRMIRLFVQSLILGLGAWLVLQGAVTSGGMLAGSVLLGRALAPIDQLIGGWRQLKGSYAAYRRLEAALDELPREQMAQPLPEATGLVQVAGVSQKTPGSNTSFVLSQIAFEVEPGTAVGIIGHSGSGKTTLCRLLAGVIEPSIGKVRLDGAEIGQWQNRPGISAIGYLPQSVELFPGTIRENIARFGEADDVAIRKAAELAGVDKLILSLPEGYNTMLVDGIQPLSAGQRQRIGLARALYGDPKLVILDEPNSNLDTEGEQALNTAIEIIKAGDTTVFIVAHRPSALEAVDKVLVLQQGKMTAFAPKADVLAKRVSASPENKVQPANGRQVPLAAGAKSAANGQRLLQLIKTQIDESKAADGPQATAKDEPSAASPAGRAADSGGKDELIGLRRIDE